MEIVNNIEKNKEFRKKAEELVAQMTVEELVSQTVHTAPAIERLGIPAYNWWNEALHGVARAGVATVFPQSIGLAAMFDEDMMEIVADAISTEGRAKYNMQQEFNDSDIYKGLTFWSPNINIFRDPRWGRGHETFGEDPYLTSRLGIRFIQGLQGHDENYMKAAACAKHFVVHSGPESVRHSFDAVVSQQDLYETYLPAFKACVQEGKVEAIMGAYNRTNGKPCCGHDELLQDVLRGDWGFEGHVLSDCWAIKDFHENHKVTANGVESVSMALNNGCDLNCGSIFLLLEKAVEDGMVSIERLREAVVNLYTTRMKLGVLDVKGDNIYDKIPYSVVDSKEMKELNLDVSEKCMCLLKNANNTLPLNKEKIKTIGVIGPNANSRAALVGNYEGTSSRYHTILDGIQDYVGDDIQVMYSQACHLFKEKLSDWGLGNDLAAEVQAVCKESDVVVVVLGLDASIEGEEGDASNAFAAGDKVNLDFPGIQNTILKLAHASGKPVVLLMLDGSAMAVDWADDNVDAIVQGWYPGALGGKAFANLLFGKKNFEGKLPVTFYSNKYELPDFCDYSMKNRTYRYMENPALYPFGYGLSYTKFDYEDIYLSSNTLTDDIKIKYTVKNIGEFDGVETTQVYITAPKDFAPKYSLKGIKKVSLKAGESKEIELNIPKSAFGVFDKEAVLKIYKGIYKLSIGSGQPDQRTEELIGSKVSVFDIISENEEEV